MAFITVDFETFYRSKRLGDTPSYSLKHLTYEEYIFHPEFDPYMVGIKIGNEPTQIIEGKDTIRAYLENLFYPGNEHTMLAHNVMFDGAILFWYFGLKAKHYYCTQSMSNALWNQASASLEALAERLFPEDKTRRKTHELVSMDGVAWENALPDTRDKVRGYCANDVDLTFQCFAAMYSYYPLKELDIISMVSRWFIEPSLLLDKERCKNYLDKLIADKDNLVRLSGLSEATLGSDSKFADKVRSLTGIEIPRVPSPTLKNPNNTKLALAKNDLEFLAIRKDHPEFAHLWDARIAVKSNGERNRADRLLRHVQPNGTIAVPLKYSGAHTHRLSGTNSVNFQNFKRGSELRKSLVAPDGRLVFVADLSNIESRKLAWFANEKKLLEGFKNKEDIYSIFASSVYERPIDRKRVIPHPLTGKPYKPDELEGFVGKVCILGLGYGMGPATFQRTLAQGALGGPQIFFEMDRCTDIVYNKYRKEYRAIATLWKTCDRIIREMANPALVPFEWRCLRVEHQRLVLPNGLCLNYPGLKAYDKEGDIAFHYWNGMYWKDLYGGLLCENIIQALSRITMTDMTCEIDKLLMEEFDGQVVLTVHDEIVALAPDHEPDVIMEAILNIMKKPPSWCNDGTLALDAEGGYDTCYSK